jgi:hypothetical protein
MSIRVNNQIYVDGGEDGLIDWTQYATPSTYGLDAGANTDLIQIATNGDMTTKGKIIQLSNSNSITIEAPSTLADTYTITYPEDQPTSGQVMKFNGTGMEWVTPYSDPTTTAGDIAYRNNSNVLTRLPTGAPGQILGAGPAWKDNTPNAVETCIFDDFCGITSPFGDYPWILVSTGSVSSALAFPTSSSNVIGCASYSLNQSTDTFGLRRNVTTGMYFGGAFVIFEAGINIGSLSGISNSYVFRLGFGDVFTGTSDMNNGIYFEYDKSISDNWIIKTASGGVRTETVTSTPVLADTWTRMRIEVSTSSATFYIGGTNVGTISSNFPSGTSTRCSPTIRASRLAGIALTYIFYLDYLLYKSTFASNRY